MVLRAVLVNQFNLFYMSYQIVDFTDYFYFSKLMSLNIFYDDYIIDESSTTLFKTK